MAFALRGVQSPITMTTLKHARAQAVTLLCQLLRALDLSFNFGLKISETLDFMTPLIGGPGRDRTDDLFHAI